MASKPPKIMVKRGDDFRLDMTVQDLNNDAARASKGLMESTYAAYQAALAADPQVPADITSTYNAYVAAEAAFAEDIKVDITGWTITSKLAWVGKLVSTFTIVIIDPLEGTFSVRLGNAQTALWKPREYDMDVQFLRPEGKVSSETFLVIVERDITNG
jgi:hypothetical protein